MNEYILNLLRLEFILLVLTSIFPPFQSILSLELFHFHNLRACYPIASITRN